MRRTDGRRHDFELNTSEDRTTERLHAWALGSPSLTDIGLSAQAGKHNEYQQHSRIVNEQPSEKALANQETNAYIGHFHVRRHGINWPTPLPDGPSPGRPGSWLTGCSAQQVRRSKLDRGWYVLVNRMRNDERCRSPARAAAIGPAHFLKE